MTPDMRKCATIKCRNFTTLQICSACRANGIKEPEWKPSRNVDIERVEVALKGFEVRRKAAEMEYEKHKKERAIKMLKEQKRKPVRMLYGNSFGMDAVK